MICFVGKVWARLLVLIEEPAILNWLEVDEIGVHNAE